MHCTQSSRLPHQITWWGEPLTPLYVRVTYTAVRQIPVLSLFTPITPLSLFKIRLVNSKFRPPYRIRDNLTFIPSPFRWVLHLSLMARFIWLLWPLLTSCNKNSITRPPSVRAFSFLQCLRHLLMNDLGILWTLQCCACLSSFYSLICRFCSSVPDFAVSLPSVHTSRYTTLRLTNTSGRYPCV